MKIIPNSICEGIGETPIEQRIQPWLTAAENWFHSAVSPAAVISGNGLEEQAATIIQCRALWMAAPALDVTMHPNGLAVVRTDSLAPASAERSEEFRRSVMQLMMEGITGLLPALRKIPEWRESDPARCIWLATTFHTPMSICQAVGGEYSWETVERAVTAIRAAEYGDALHFWSYPMLDFLRQYEGDDKSYQLLRWMVMKTVRDILMLERDPERFHRTMSHLGPTSFLRLKVEFVDFCRRNPELCGPWHNSETANIYSNSNAIFRNEKNSSGYFF